MDTAISSNPRTFLEGLASKGPAAEYADQLMLYGQFVGDWLAEATEFAADGTVTHSHWDIRFDWVLEGRAIQDLWITPPREGKEVSWSQVGIDIRRPSASTTLRSTPGTSSGSIRPMETSPASSRDERSMKSFNCPASTPLGR
ncbi:hypothetical protein IY145_03025 [Methylosinus sp. H3A]|uniref:hypothetical protein n=1 Tax=Methylosinus sp. H3A TaxID=2785786 RepID=UPI0018C28D69|nr:hypothetical protein [Methylosinus sp. H3A]MBG0808346.1 hypothetical protein [Methylosinus sp. H3A]